MIKPELSTKRSLNALCIPKVIQQRVWKLNLANEIIALLFYHLLAILSFKSRLPNGECGYDNLF